MEEELKKQQEELKKQDDEEKDVLFKRFIRGDFGHIESENAKLKVGKKYDEYMKKIKEVKNKKGKKKDEE